MLQILFVVATLLSTIGPAFSYVHDMILPHHTPEPGYCEGGCAQWQMNRTASSFFSSTNASVAAGAYCAMPSLALIPDLSEPIYATHDGWCLCDKPGSTGDWWAWCQPPASFPSQINLLVVNSTAVVVNFVTADDGAREACGVQGELKNVETGAITRYLPDDDAATGSFSTPYKDSTSDRVLSYHHLTLHSLKERTGYEYRVRVVNGSANPGPPPPPAPVQWVETKGIEWCSGVNYPLKADPWGQGWDGGAHWCPLLPAGLTTAQKIQMCEQVCGAENATACAGFTWYPDATTPIKNSEAVGSCCFRSDTSSKPLKPGSDAICYEKKVPAPQSNTCALIGSEWSEWLDFRSLYSEGSTKFALYADMGVFVQEGVGPPKLTHLPTKARHNIGNLADDLDAGLIDFAIHSGDHAYEFEVDAGARGDGYMDSYSAFLAHAPWAPGWGNHEYLEEDRGNRLSNITAGVIAERRRAVPETSRMFYAVEVGLLHLLHLDLSPYWCRFNGCIGVDTCGVPDEWVVDASSDDPEVRYDFAGYRAAIMAFVRADLEAVDRTKTPWVIATAHFPFYETYDDGNEENKAKRNAKADGGARGKGGSGGGNSSRGGNGARFTTPTPSKTQALLDFEPIFAEFAVDIFFAGHDHNYETTWPVYQNKAVQKNYSNPEAPIHILSGTAGPPEWDFFTAEGEDWTREPRILMNTYSRMELVDASTAHFQQVANDNGTVVDSFTITQNRRNRSAPFECFAGILADF